MRIQIFITRVVFIFAARSQAGELPLNTTVIQELNTVLKTSDSLLKAMIAQDEEQVDIGLKETVSQLDKAMTSTQLAKPHERRHIVRILEAAHEQFEQAESAFGEARKTRLLEGFNQLVNIVRIYKVDRSFSIFFCPKDRATWVQKGMRSQNPFMKDTHESCAIRVPK